MVDEGGWGERENLPEDGVGEGGLVDGGVSARKMGVRVSCLTKEMTEIAAPLEYWTSDANAEKIGRSSGHRGCAILFRFSLLLTKFAMAGRCHPEPISAARGRLKDSDHKSTITHDSYKYGSRLSNFPPRCIA